jgi:hypothetical protein
VIACIALAVALSETSYAALVLPANSVGSKQIKNRAIQRIDLGRKTISALRGQRGPQGIRGLQGPEGPRGPLGLKGDIGPSNGFYAHDDLLDVPPGNYVVYGQLVNDNSAGAISGTASVKLIVAGAGATGQTPTSYGNRGGRHAGDGSIPGNRAPAIGRKHRIRHQLHGHAALGSDGCPGRDLESIRRVHEAGSPIASCTYPASRAEGFGLAPLARSCMRLPRPT